MIDKIVFTSPEAMVEFSGRKINLGARQNPLNMQIYICLKGQLWDLFSFELGKQKSPITNHATTLCKECENLLQPRDWANFSLRSWRNAWAGEAAIFLAGEAREEISSGDGDAASEIQLDSSPILSRLGHSRSRLRYQNKSTRARNPASYAG